MSKKEERIIKKYANRRLYDTFDSQYIAFKELQDLIFKGYPLKIIDIKTKEDVTHSVIVSLIVENSEIFGQFTDDFLKNIIRLYGYNNQQREVVSNFFQKSLENFTDSHTKYKDPLSIDMVEYLNDLGKRHQELTQKFMNELLKFGKPT